MNFRGTPFSLQPSNTITSTTSDCVHTGPSLVPSASQVLNEYWLSSFLRHSHPRRSLSSLPWGARCEQRNSQDFTLVKKKKAPLPFSLWFQMPPWALSPVWEFSFPPRELHPACSVSKTLHWHLKTYSFFWEFGLRFRWIFLLKARNPICKKSTEWGWWWY